MSFFCWEGLLEEVILALCHKLSRLGFMEACNHLRFCVLLLILHVLGLISRISRELAKSTGSARGAKTNVDRNRVVFSPPSRIFLEEKG